VSPTDATSLIAKVPGAAPLVGDWRRRYDPWASVDPHITIVAPFLASSAVTPAVLRELDSIVASRRLVVCFDRIAHLPGAVCLIPAQDAELANLTSAVVARWPQLRATLRTGLRPYHLTAACTDDPRVAEKMRAAIAPALPTEKVATEVQVIAADGHRLEVLHRAALEGAQG
jgi:2'-5' RNA ligase superfamily